ncbi:hypothetical protein TNCV_1360771 [Trichonephila clavipes]|nr:hypothetical protein TNCV_1360771 [Trichonephila clavipes]
MVVRVYEDQALSMKCVYKWFPRFREGQKSVFDNPRSKRSVTSVCDENIEKVIKLITKCAVGSLVVRASDSRPEGLGSMPPNNLRVHMDLHAEIVEVEIEVVSPSTVPSGNFAELNRTVTCMVLKANDRRTSCPCHDEFREPRSDYVRQVASENTTTTNNERSFINCGQDSWTMNASRYIETLLHFMKRLRRVRLQYAQVAQQSMRARNYYAHLNIRDQALRYMIKFADLVVCLKRPSVFKTRNKLGTHLSSQCSGDERQS